MSEDGGPRLNTRLFAAVFCPNCQFSIVSANERQVCPECGEQFDVRAGDHGETRIVSPIEAGAPRSKPLPRASKRWMVRKPRPLCARAGHLRR